MERAPVSSQGFSEADLKQMQADEEFVKSGGGRAPKHHREPISPDERKRRRAKNKQRKASRKKNR